MGWWQDKVEKPFNDHVVNPLVDAANDAGGAVSRTWKDAGSGVSNWWKSLPPEWRIAIIVVAFVAIGVATGGVIGIGALSGGGIGITSTWVIGGGAAGGFSFAGAAVGAAAGAYAGYEAGVHMEKRYEEEGYGSYERNDGQDDKYRGPVSKTPSDEKPSPKKESPSPTPLVKSSTDQKQVDIPSDANSKENAARANAPEDQDDGISDPSDLDLDDDNAEIESDFFGAGTNPTSGTSVDPSVGQLQVESDTARINVASSDANSSVETHAGASGLERVPLERPMAEPSQTDSGRTGIVEVGRNEWRREDRYEKQQSSFQIGMAIFSGSAATRDRFFVEFDPKERTVLWQSESRRTDSESNERSEKSSSSVRTKDDSRGTETTAQTRPKDWSTWDAAVAVYEKFANVLSGAPAVSPSMARYKDEWVAGYADVITGLAAKYDLPDWMIGSVAWTEVGGKPYWLDDVPWVVRSATELQTTEWRSLMEKIPGIGTVYRPSENTSFGPTAVQIRRAAVEFGMDPAALSIDEEWRILSALKDPVVSLEVTASYLDRARDIFFGGKHSRDFTLAELSDLASRYNRWDGRGEKARNYGDDITRPEKRARIESLLDGE